MGQEENGAGRSSGQVGAQGADKGFHAYPLDLIAVEGVRCVVDNDKPHFPFLRQLGQGLEHGRFRGPLSVRGCALLPV